MIVSLKTFGVFWSFGFFLAVCGKEADEPLIKGNRTAIPEPQRPVDQVSAKYEYVYTYEDSVETPKADRRAEKKTTPPENEYHYPYRPKFPAHSSLGYCKLQDFKFGESDRLGKGGFGQVYKAIHKSGKVVAIKHTLAQSIKDKPNHVENEETIHRTLQNPFIGQLLCTMKNSKNDIFFALEYSPGGDMHKQISTYYPYSQAVLAKYVAQIVLALRYMHYNCVVYRDLKAENIMIDENDNIKLGDLGLAKYDCDNDLSNLAGTVEYLAPEVAGKRKYGRACDYYSLAVLVYHLQTGRLPYKHKKEQKEAFIKQLAAGKQKIASTGNASADELIRILSDYDPVQRWSNVYVNFEKFKGLKYFDGIDWNMLEDISANQY
jgi:hypothetical protein